MPADPARRHRTAPATAPRADADVAPDEVEVPAHEFGPIASGLDESGQPPLGRPQLPVDEERCELRGHDVAPEQPKQEVLVASRQGGPDGTGPRGA